MAMHYLDSVLTLEMAETSLFRDKGYLLFEHTIDPKSDDWAAFHNYWNDLVADQYLSPQFGSRARRHSRFIWCSKAGALLLTKRSEFIQAPEYNSLFGGLRRKFSPLRGKVLRDPVFKLLLENEIKLLNLDKDSDWIVDLDFMRTISGEVAGHPCPEGRHQDGYEYIGIHFVAMHKAIAPVTEITLPPGDLVQAFYLRKPGQLLILDDKMYYHYTYPFLAPNAQAGWRDTMLTGYRRKL